MKYLLGIDLGTTSIKVAIYTDAGKIAGTATVDYDLLIPLPMHVEQTHEEYWSSFKRALSGAIGDSSVNPMDIVALSISSQGETMVPVDKKGNPLHNFVVWPDMRAIKEADYISSCFTYEQLNKTTGQVKVAALAPGAKILWFKNNKPNIFKNTYKFLLLEDFFFYKLGGVFKGEGSLWCTSRMWDINTKTWWGDMLETIGVSSDMLPEIVESGTPLGTILPNIANELGLSENILLVMGGLDQACGAIGVGNIKPGIFSESTGAAMAACTMSEHIVFDGDGLMPCFYSAIPGLYMMHAFSSGGIAVKWLRDFLYDEKDGCEPKSYKHMDALAKDIPAGSEGLVVLPHFNGSGPPDSNNYAKCVYWGIGLHHSRGHFIRSMMEGVASGLCRMLKATEQLMGFEVEEIRCLGGGSNSSLWCQIKSDICQKPILITNNTDDAACVGAVILAGVGAGVFESVEEAVAKMIKPAKTFKPDDNNKEAYEKLLENYDVLTKTTKSITELF